MTGHGGGGHRARTVSGRSINLDEELDVQHGRDHNGDRLGHRSHASPEEDPLLDKVCVVCVVFVVRFGVATCETA